MWMMLRFFLLTIWLFFCFSFANYYNFYQFADEAFDVVLDKGGLDALMEPELGPKLGHQYLLEVSWTLTWILFIYAFLCTSVLCTNSFASFAFRNCEIFCWIHISWIVLPGEKTSQIWRKVHLSYLGWVSCSRYCFSWVYMHNEANISIFFIYIVCWCSIDEMLTTSYLFIVNFGCE